MSDSGQSGWGGGGPVLQALQQIPLAINAQTKVLLQLLGLTQPTPWIPADGSGAGLALTVSNALYAQLGPIVVATASITYPATANGNNAAISGLPIPVNAGTLATVIFGYTSFASGGFAGNVAGGATSISFYIAGVQQKNSDMTGRAFNMTLVYLR